MAGHFTSIVLNVIQNFFLNYKYNDFFHCICQYYYQGFASQKYVHAENDIDKHYCMCNYCFLIKDIILKSMYCKNVFARSKLNF